MRYNKPLLVAFVVMAASVAHAQVAQQPASSSNFTPGRTSKIDTIVIHKAEGSAASTWSWFQNPSSQVSAHYVVGDDGAVTQMVADGDTAWHAGNWDYNCRSIGIENSGFTAQNDISETHMKELARLCRTLCDKHGIALDRQHIIGHVEVPGATHTDPGHFFDWPKFMQYLRNGAANPALATRDGSAVSTSYQTARTQGMQSSSYTIQWGDCLSTLAEHWGTSVGSLLAANPEITNPDLIFAGAQLNVPSGVAVPGVYANQVATAYGSGNTHDQIPGADAALAWAQQEPEPINPNTGMRDWARTSSGELVGWCLGLVNCAYQAAGHSVPELTKGTAHEAFLAFDGEGKIHKLDPNNAPPRGAVIFFDSFVASGENVGHTGICNGDWSYTGIVFNNGKGGTIQKHCPIDLKKANGWANPTGTSSTSSSPPQQSQAPQGAGVNASASDLEVLARIVKGEIPSFAPREGQVAVAAVVLNRVKAGMGTTITEVAHAPFQFSCYNAEYRARLYDGPIPDYAWAAAKAALAGENPVPGCTHYFNPYLVQPSWASTLTFVKRIGDTAETTHVFYKP